MIDDFHGPDLQVVEEAARGFAKSTIGEEATCIQAQFMDFANGVIVGSTEARAVERLAAIKHELENNDNMIELFGEQAGPIWQAHKVVLQNGVCLQALGVGQAVRGIKHHAFRPDYIWFDDIEDDESAKTPESSQQRLKWLYGTLFPVCAKGARKRGTGNRLSPDAVITKLANDPSWKSQRYPILHLDMLTGEEVPTWPALYDMEWIVKTRDEYERLGLDQEWASEYMCEAISEAVKPFKVDVIRINPRVRSWEPVHAMWDPAKTASNKRHQSHYGKGVWSYIGRKIHVWECTARPMMPSELIDDIFATEKQYNCVSLNVEQDGLEEWLNEPLRKAQTDRRILLPHLKPQRAPRDKDSFIKSLEPFFNSNEIEFNCELPDLRAQMLNFPSGRKDALNVLAYALKLRPGQPIYNGFNSECITDNIEITLRSSRYLCLNADGAFVTGVLVQYDGTLSIIADWIETGDPGQCVGNIIKQAMVAATGDVEIIVPPKEMDRYHNKGVVAALRRVPRDCRNGNNPLRGRDEIRDLLATRADIPLVQIDGHRASWTARAFAGGYHRPNNTVGHPDDQPEEGAYKTLMEGLETFAGIMHHESTDGIGGTDGLYRTGRTGQTYRSLIGQRR